MPSLVAALLPLASLSALVLLPGSSWDIDEACFPSTAWERRVARLVRERRLLSRARRVKAERARRSPLRPRDVQQIYLKRLGGAFAEETANEVRVAIQANERLPDLLWVQKMEGH